MVEGRDPSTIIITYIRRLSFLNKNTILSIESFIILFHLSFKCIKYDYCNHLLNMIIYKYLYFDNNILYYVNVNGQHYNN